MSPEMRAYSRAADFDDKSALTQPKSAVSFQSNF